MIEYLRGNLLRVNEDHVIVDVGGIGYGLDVPHSTLEILPGPGEAVELFVSFQVREDSMKLYGFATPAEKTIFEIFLNVSGIGPRTSLDVLSIPLREIVPAIRLGNVAVLTRIPGIGRKKAERLIVELKDRLQSFPDLSDVAPGGESKLTPRGEETAPKPDLYEDAVNALLSLGLKPAAATRNVSLALRSVEAENPTVEEIVKMALQMR